MEQSLRKVLKIKRIKDQFATQANYFFNSRKVFITLASILIFIFLFTLIINIQKSEAAALPHSFQVVDFKDLTYVDKQTGIKKAYGFGMAQAGREVSKREIYVNGNIVYENDFFSSLKKDEKKRKGLRVKITSCETYVETKN